MAVKRSSLSKKILCKGLINTLKYLEKADAIRSGQLPSQVGEAMNEVKELIAYAKCKL